ncbi:hypothetical protein V6Z11_A05G367900 [Gossypium hirsutum]
MSSFEKKFNNIIISNSNNIAHCYYLSTPKTNFFSHSQLNLFTEMNATKITKLINPLQHTTKQIENDEKKNQHEDPFRVSRFSRFKHHSKTRTVVKTLKAVTTSHDRTSMMIQQPGF